MSNVFKLFLTKQLSFTAFIFTQFLILVLSLIFLAALYHLLNKDFVPPSKDLKFYTPISSKVTSLTLEINQPDDNILVFDADLLISGKTLPNLKILITTNHQDLVIDSKKDGSFSTILELDEGVNYIEAYVFGSNGEERVDQRTVFYSKEKI